MALAVGVMGLAGAGVWMMQVSEDAGPEPSGVTEARAIERRQRVSDVVYDLKLRVPAERTGDIAGTMTMSFSLGHSRTPLVIDFGPADRRLTSTVVNSVPTQVTTANGHIIVPARALADGDNSITFEFVAGDEPLNRQDDLLYSLLVPARASQAFPCFDQPDIKARWRFALDVPRGWTAVSNGREAGKVTTGTVDSFLFDETSPIPTYLFAFAAGRFEVETVVRPHRTFRIFHRETDGDRITRNRDAIVDQHEQALSWMERYTAIPYAFGKFDIVLIPSMQFSGMEHPGAIFYNADLLLLDTSASRAQELSRANVIAHETAHMWFGNFVTMTWFNDVWMKEVFANFMAAAMVNPAFPEMHHDLRFFTQHYPAAYDVDRTAGANPIRQPLDNLNDAGSLYGPIIYQKAPIAMRQLEMLIGADVLRDGLRDFLATYAFGNAGWPELIARLDRRTPQDLRAWSRAWIESAGRPTLKVERVPDGGGASEVALRQSDPLDRGLVWPQRLQLLIGRGTTAETHEVVLDDAVVSIGGVIDPGFEWVLPSGGGLGYGAVELEPAALRFLMASARDLDDPLARAVAFHAIWEAMLDNRVSPSEVFGTLIDALAVERNELTLQLLLDQSRTLFWRFTDADHRPARAERLEGVLRKGLAGATETRTRAAWFATLRDVAVTAATVNRLEEIWARTEQVEGLPLSEMDETTLSLDLALRLPANATAIIATQLGRITNHDRRARLEFIAPAVSPDAPIRTAFFDSLANVSNRSRESWVLDAVRYLHHPLRADQTSGSVVPALRLTREIQRTGDIFFPKRWVDATLAGYQTRAVSDDVRQFIESLPSDYPPRLRQVLLSAADPLARAATLLAR